MRLAMIQLLFEACQLFWLTLKKYRFFCHNYPLQYAFVVACRRTAHAFLFLKPAAQVALHVTGGDFPFFFDKVLSDLQKWRKIRVANGVEL